MAEIFHDKLTEILQSKQAEIERLRPHAAELRRLALARDDFRGFRRALFQPGNVTLIAEVKKASPSAGLIAAEFNPVNQAREYQRGGADSLSVLTDEKFFQGALPFLRDIRQQVDLPLLRKDFILDELQVYESALAGADAILLIAAALADDELDRLYNLARDLQLDVLVEVHDMAEMDRALDLGADIIGINNRSLRTFEVSLENTERLAGEIPADCLGVSESGIKTPADVQRCRAEGIECFLIGEALMRSGDVRGAIAELKGI
ncbi:MAG: indole-3-glycerol phosphate synthase TrpC [Verrucomicrobiales bacterium]|jgi:indole-3-glycerol phosphate synthase|nr:indole-3-glycerol phosphate synthase TrpC [Verrucomicrobiales bacterium]